MSAIEDEGYKKGEQIRAEGVRDAMLIRQATAVAAAIANASDMIANYKKQRDIQDLALKISEEEKQHLKDVYWPRELEFLKEFGTPEEKEEAEVYGRRFAGRLAASVAGKMAIRINKLKCEAARYCSSQFIRMMQSEYQAYTDAVSNAKVLGYMTGFAYWHAMNDRDFKRRQQALGLGKDLLSTAASLYQAAGAGLANAGSDLTGMFSRALEGFNTARVNTYNSVPNIDYYLNNQEGTMTDSFGSKFRSQFGQAKSYTNVDENAVIESSMMGDFSLQAGQVSEYSANLQNDVIGDYRLTYGLRGPDYNTFAGIQREGWNNADIGNNDLVRTGSYTYNITDSDGDRISLTVDLDKHFPQYVFKDEEHY